MNKLVALVDADFLKYLVLYDIEKMYKSGLNPNVGIPEKTLIQLIETRIKLIKNTTKLHTKSYVFLFSGKTRNNYRALIAAVKQYKGTRKYTEKVKNEAVYRNSIEEYVKENYTYFRYEELEADDLAVMGHMKGTYIYSYDKDLRNSPGIHFDIKKKKFFKVDKVEGFKSLLIQTMTGDAVDNIAGLEGVGKVGAKKLLANIREPKLMVDAVLFKYMDTHGVKPGLDRFVEMYSLVNMRDSRGAWTKEKYSDYFDCINGLILKQEDEPEGFFD
jgi:hypothetical protein